MLDPSEVKKISFRGSWIDLRAFESALKIEGAHEGSEEQVQFHFPANSKLMVDAALRLLSLSNQLVLAGKQVKHVFAEEANAFGYLDRIGYFDHLDPDVEVVPQRPRVSGAQIYRGNTVKVVEIEAISPAGADSLLPSKLADALENSVHPHSEASKIGKAAFSVFAELIQNIPLHSETPLDGYAALQVYEKGGRAKVAVSDSGKGILATLRPTLQSWNPRASTLSDTDLVVEAFRSGLSRHGRGRGCGLQTSARHALKFRAELDVRLPTCRVHLVPSSGGYQPHVAHCTANLPLLRGTHICFDFRLDL